MDRAEERLRELEAVVAPYGSALVAFSGGVDSSLALAIAARALPRGRVLAVTSNNETYLSSELNLARGFAASLGVEHLVVNTRELDDPNYASNPANRCYFCKSTLYSDLARLAEERGYGCVVDGANKDDEGDYRPGRKAAKELGVVSPLSAAGMGKAEVRELARHLGLPSWDKPALACLSSRFPYGQNLRRAQGGRLSLRRPRPLRLRIRQPERSAPAKGQEVAPYAAGRLLGRGSAKRSDTLDHAYRHAGGTRREG